jgi:hypothetical protein
MGKHVIICMLALVHAGACMLMNGSKVSRVVRLQQIVDVVWRADEPIGRLEISRRSGLGNNAYLWQLLDELVREGVLLAQVDDRSPQVLKPFLYYRNDDYVFEGKAVSLAG